MKSILIQREINAQKNIFFDRLVEYTPEELISMMEKEVLPPEAKKIDKIAFFKANKLLLANYVDEGKAGEARSLIELILSKFSNLIEMEFLALSQAIEEEKEIFEEHPEYKEKFKIILHECFGKFATSEIEKHKIRWEETIKVLAPEPNFLIDSDGEDLLGQQSVDNKSDEE